MDRMLARTGDGPSVHDSDQNHYLFSRGRAVFMKEHDPSVLGFGGDVAYWESISGKGAYAIDLSVGGQKLTLTEDTSKRKQTPSYWSSTFTTSNSAITVVETKYITDANVAVTGFTVSNAGSQAVTVQVAASSPYATSATAQGDELTGTVPAYNDLTTIYPRLSGDGMTAADGQLTGSLSVPAGGSTTSKVQMGFVTHEITDSRSEYDTYRGDTPAAAYTKHVTEYNQWWADNIPYLDIPDKNVEKTIYYRWWLMRFNYLDADIPGNDYQFPTSVEGALGYNNAIDLTLPLFIDDLKYFRNAAYSYGPWVSAGEVAGNGQFVDNPGDPANWSASHAQYISASAWRSYELHGGPAPIAEKLATYAEGDVNGQLAAMDSNHNDVLDTNWNSWTGNDSDAVSFDYKPGVSLDRPETAFTWANAEAGEAAYQLAGDSSGASRLGDLAGKIRTGVLNTLWDSDDKELLSAVASTGEKDPWKEINNYDPYTVGMMPTPDGTTQNDQYTEALRFFADADEFPIFPFYTADQKDKAAATAAGRPGTNNFSVINSTGLMNMMASAIRHYPSSYITGDSLKKLIDWNAWAAYQDDGDNRYPDTNEFWANGSADPQDIGYRSWIHQTILGATNHTIIEDMMGLQPQADDTVEMWPIDMGVDHFAASNIRYRNANLSITWVKPGATSPYGADVPEGYSIYVNGTRVATAPSLEHFVYHPDSGTVTFPDGTGTADYATTSDLEAPQDVTYAASSRTSDIFADVGVDLSAPSQVDLAANATATATYSASGQAPAGVVDGTTAIKPRWGTAGTTHAHDTVTLTLPQSKTVDDLQAFFYSDKLAGGEREPATYTVEYDDGGTWKPVTGQSRTPAYPQANHNEVRFAPVTTDAIRVEVTPQAGFSTGIKELQLFDTGDSVTGTPNAAPQVAAYDDHTAVQPGTVHLTGTVKDDGLPGDTLTQHWSVVSAPDGGSAVFDDATAPSTTARFTKGGSYTLELTATDGALQGSTQVVVDAADPTGALNIAGQATPSASYTAGWNALDAVNDGEELNSGGDQTQLWGTWSGTRPASQWLQYTWPAAVRVSGSDITFWHDSPQGTGDGVAVPASWKLQYLDADGTTWHDMTGADQYGTADTGSNPTQFDPVTTTAVRAVFNADSNGTTYSAVGVSEWKVLADTPESVDETDVRTTPGVVPTMPSTVDLVYSDGSRVEAPVTWQELTSDDVAADGTSVPVTGVVAGSGLVAHGTVWIRSQLGSTITSVVPVAVHTPVGQAPHLPSTVTAVYNDGTSDSRIAVAWASVDASQYAAAGTFTVQGDVAGTDLSATATVTVGDQQTGSDTTAPTLSVTADPAAASGTNGWYTGPVTLTPSAADDQDPAPAVQAAIDGGAWTPVTGAIVVGDDGEHEVSVRAVDAAGNVSDVSTWTGKIDTVKPVSTAAFDAGARTLTLQATDATSGVDQVRYRIGDGDWKAYTGPVTLGAAAATVTYNATDKAGNVESPNVVQIPAAGVALSGTTTGLTLDHRAFAVGAKNTARVTVTGLASGTPTGTVRLLSAGVEIGRATLSNGSAVVALDTTHLSAGHGTVSVAYSGDARFAASSDAVAVTVTKASSKIHAKASKRSVRRGAKLRVKATVKAPGLTPAGTVVVTYHGHRVGKALLENGTAVLRIKAKALPVGHLTLKVRYLGSAQVHAAHRSLTVQVRARH
jgi:hypothetical protein